MSRHYGVAVECAFCGARQQLDLMPTRQQKLACTDCARRLDTEETQAPPGDDEPVTADDSIQVIVPRSLAPLVEKMARLHGTPPPHGYESGNLMRALATLARMSHDGDDGDYGGLIVRARAEWDKLRDEHKDATSYADDIRQRWEAGEGALPDDLDAAGAFVARWFGKEAGPKDAASRKADVGELARMFAAVRREATSALRQATDAAVAFEQLCTIYRTGGRPSETLLRRLDKAREVTDAARRAKKKGGGERKKPRKIHVFPPHETKGWHCPDCDRYVRPTDLDLECKGGGE